MEPLVCFVLGQNGLLQKEYKRDYIIRKTLITLSFLLLLSQRFSHEIKIKCSGHRVIVFFFLQMPSVHCFIAQSIAFPTQFRLL